MKILTQPGEEAEYCAFMDKIAMTVCRESFKGIKEMNSINAVPKDYSEELGVAMGQVVFDQIIEMTKDMDRDKFLRIFTEASIAHVVSAMQENPRYRLKILMESGAL